MEDVKSSISTSTSQSEDAGSIDAPFAELCKRKFDAMASPMKMITSPLSSLQSPASPANGFYPSVNVKMAPTPVSIAMTTARWLQTVISPVPLKPSAELEWFLSLCDRDISDDVICSTHILLEAIFPGGALGDRSIAGSLQSATWIAYRQNREEWKLKVILQGFGSNA